MKKFHFFKASALAVVVCAAICVSCKKDDDKKTEEVKVEVSGVTLNKAALALLESATEQLTATVAPNNAENKTLTWTSSAEAVATVSATGLVTAVGAGEATITARASTGTAGTCVVSVTAKTLTVDKTAIDAAAAAGTYAIAVTANVAWTAAVDAAATWCNIAPTSGNGNGTITVTVTANGGYAARTATITLTAGALTQTITLTQAAPEGFEIGGVTWALTNLQGGTAAHGATFAATPADFGSYYQGNRPKGWSADNLTGWDTSDPGDTWEEANSPCPTGWRVPTADEWMALFTAGRTYVAINAAGNPVRGAFYGAKSAEATWDNPQGCIFLPYDAGYIGGSNGVVNPDAPYYWTSTSKTFFSGVATGTSAYSAGCSVRCVK